MRRKVTLAGELKEKFGEVFYVNADSHQSILKCINANRPEFKQYLLESIDKNVGFTIDMAGESVAEEDLLTPLKDGDVTITAIPAGSKSGMGKILAAIALAVLVIYTAGAAHSPQRPAQQQASVLLCLLAWVLLFQVCR